MDDYKIQPNSVFAQELFENLQKEIKKEPCRVCDWKKPENCIRCQGTNKTIVLVVNKGGLKHGT